MVAVDGKKRGGGGGGGAEIGRDHAPTGLDLPPLPAQTDTFKAASLTQSASMNQGSYQRSLDALLLLFPLVLAERNPSRSSLKQLLCFPLDSSDLPKNVQPILTELDEIFASN